MIPEPLRQERQKKLLVMTDEKLCDEMRKYDSSFQKQAGFIARTIRERILKIEFPEFTLPTIDPAKSHRFNSP